MAHILVVDDDADMRALVRGALERDGHAVTALACGAQVTPEHCAWAHCILLDVMMPGEDGFATCARIRALAGCPILFLTARAEETDVLRRLGLGGDDYLTKPFRVAELRARVAAHLRREARVPTRRVRRGAFDFDLASKTLYYGDAALPLTKSEYAICEYLATHAGQVFSKEQIYEAVFGYDGCADDSAVTEHVKNIRAKLKAAGGAPIETVWGIGYKWKNEEM